jgi:hypothetical protein
MLSYLLTAGMEVAAAVVILAMEATMTETKEIGIITMSIIIITEIMATMTGITVYM